MDVARQDLPEAKFHEANSRSGYENEENGLNGNGRNGQTP
jgi:hypothetical protein